MKWELGTQLTGVSEENVALGEPVLTAAAATCHPK